MTSPLATLTTDFGYGSPYTAQMKGMLLSVCPDARIVDLSHAIAPQNVRQGAVFLEDTTLWFPEGTLHVAVIDPGVGTERKLIYAEIGSQRYLTPDNGLLSRLTRRHSPSCIFELGNYRYFPGSVSALFDSGETLATFAGHVLKGAAAESLGPVVPKLADLTWSDSQVLPDCILGEVLYIDPFGNLTSNITAAQLQALPGEHPNRTIECAGHRMTKIQWTYSARPAGEVVAVIDCNQRLEIAVVNGNAAKQIGASEGTPIMAFGAKES